MAFHNLKRRLRTPIQSTCGHLLRAHTTLGRCIRGTDEYPYLALTSHSKRPTDIQTFLGFARAVASATNGSSGQ